MDWKWNNRDLNPLLEKKFQIKLEIPNKYSKNILIRDSNFIFSDRTSTICIAAKLQDRLEADFKREHQNVEIMFRHRPVLGDLAALPPSVSQLPGKCLSFFYDEDQ